MMTNSLTQRLKGHKENLCCGALAGEGASVVVNDLGIALDGRGASKAPADEVAAEIKKGGGAAVASYDTVATAEGGANIIKTAVSSFGRIGYHGQ
ncbi:MAG: hypothetical protein HY673_00695 [Chloroflexi bacterium]|nr:hypothetical protein [Chloroflexota bacterium]